MNGFSISNTLVINKIPFTNYISDQNIKVEESKVEESKVEESKVEESKVEESKVEESKVIDFNFSDFNLAKKSYLPNEKSLLTFNNSNKKWIWCDVKTEISVE
jgi:hypothetical protein